MNAAAVRRVAGRVLLSTDVLLGLLIGWIMAFGGASRSTSVSIGHMLVICAVVAVACVVWRWFISLAWVQWVWEQRHLASLETIKGFLLTLVLVGLMIYCVMAVSTDMPWWARAPATLLLGTVTALITASVGTLVWVILLTGEATLIHLVMRPFLGADHHAFEAMRAAPALAWDAEAIKARRRGLLATWSAARARNAQTKAEAAARKRPDAPAEPGMPRWVIFVGIVFALNMVRMLTK